MCVCVCVCVRVSIFGILLHFLVAVMFFLLPLYLEKNNKKITSTTKWHVILFYMHMHELSKR